MAQHDTIIEILQLININVALISSSLYRHTAILIVNEAALDDRTFVILFYQLPLSGTRYLVSELTVLV